VLKVRITTEDVLDRAINGDKKAARIAVEKFPFLTLGCDGLPAKMRGIVDDQGNQVARSEWRCAKAALKGDRFNATRTVGGQTIGCYTGGDRIVKVYRPRYAGGIPDGTSVKEWDLFPLRDDVFEI